MIDIRGGSGQCVKRALSAHQDSLVMFVSIETVFLGMGSHGHCRPGRKCQKLFAGDAM